MITQNTCQIDITFKTFIRGLASETYSDIFIAYKQLYLIGNTVAPKIVEYINEINVVEMKQPMEVRLFSGMFSLLSDVDEKQAKNLGKTIVSMTNNPAVKSIVNNICRFTLNNFVKFKVSSLLVFEDKKLKSNSNVKQFLTRWVSNVPSKDLKGIERVYVVLNLDKGHFGEYMPILSTITLILIKYQKSRISIKYLDSLKTEVTFYHEIGHHVYRHTFCNSHEQEKEANIYANKLMVKSHPILRWLGLIPLFKN